MINLLETNQTLEKTLDSLYNGDFQQRWEMAKILPKFGAIAIKPLQEILLNENEEVEIRWFCLKTLGEFDDIEIIWILMKLLETTEEEELITLASDIFAKQGKQAIKTLSNLINFSSYQLLATKALAQIPSQEVIEPLLSVVTSDDIEVRVTAIEALSNFNDARITEILIKALKDNSSRVRKEAVINLSLRAKFQPELQVTSLIAELLYDLNLEVCQKAAIALSRLNTKTSAQALFQCLKNSHTPLALKSSIIKALGWMETQESLEYLEEALFLVDEILIIEIITVLGRIREENLRYQAVEILLNFYHSGHSSLNNSKINESLAYAWLQLLDYRAKSALIELEKSQESLVKIHANAALKLIMNKE